MTGKPTMSLPRVSVLLPVYNAEATLAEALRSIRGQTLRDLEVVAVDDGSSDGSSRILGEAAASDSRIRPVTLGRSGLIAALNAGLRHCRAPCVARMDADDLSLPERLERQVEMLERDPGLGVVGCLVEGFPRTQVGEGMRVYLEWQNRLRTHEEILRELFIESPITHPSACVRRSVLEEAGGYEDRGWAEDYDLWLRLAASGVRFAKVPEVLLRWREHPGRLTRTDSRYSVENFLRAKAHYLLAGPLRGRDAVFVWGAGKTGRRLSKHLARGGCTPAAFIDIDPARIGRTLRRVAIVSAAEFAERWRRWRNPMLLSAVASRGARAEIGRELQRMALAEGRDYLHVA